MPAFGSSEGSHVSDRATTKRLHREVGSALTIANGMRDVKVIMQEGMDEDTKELAKIAADAAVKPFGDLLTKLLEPSFEAIGGGGATSGKTGERSMRRNFFRRWKKRYRRRASSLSPYRRKCSTRSWKRGRDQSPIGVDETRLSFLRVGCRLCESMPSAIEGEYVESSLSGHLTTR